MENENHYYIEGYSAESDPYAFENGVLINQFGIKNFQSLNEIEADIAGIEMRALVNQEPPLVFDKNYLCSLHAQIFGRIYPWAGKLRKVDIAKGDTYFLHHQKIESELDAIFTKLEDKNFLKNISQEEFSQETGEFLSQLNFIHPFREGNGRVQRLLVSQLARSVGFVLNWKSVGNDAMKRACIEGLQGNTRQMVRLILLNLSR